MASNQPRTGFIKIGNSTSVTTDCESGKTIRTEIEIAVYAVIKSYMNSKTRECFPSIETIRAKLGLCKSSTIAAIKNLVANGDMQIIRKGRSNHYLFPEENENWKRISYEFLDIPANELTALEKGFIILLRKYFYENTNIVNISIRGLAEKLNVNHNTFTKRIKTLIGKGYVSKVNLNIKTNFINRYAMQFNMEKLKLELDKVTERVEKVESKVEVQAKNYNDLKKEFDDFKELILSKIK